MFLYEFTFFFAACLWVQIGHGRHTGMGPEEHELLPPVIQSLANEPLPKDPLAIDDFRNHAINVGNMIAELLRHEMRMLSRISRTPIGSPSLMEEPTNAIIHGGAAPASPVGSNQVPITTTVITTYAGASPSVAISSPHTSPIPTYTQPTSNQAVQANSADNNHSIVVPNSLAETPTNSIGATPLAYNTPQQTLTDESLQMTHHTPSTDVMSDSSILDQTPLVTLNSVPAPPPQINTLAPNQQHGLTSSAHTQIPPTVVSGPTLTSSPNGQIVFNPSQPPPPMTANPLVTNQPSDLSSSAAANLLPAVQPISGPTQPTVAQPLPVQAPPAANPIV